MVTYLDSIIGITYADEPVLYLICCLIIIWFIYQFWTFIYYVFGVNK